MEIAERKEHYPQILDSYVQQGQMFLFCAAQNLVQFGRVLTEAKPLVPHGKFESWVQTNFHMSERTAQGYMAVWKRFGAKDLFQNIQFSSLQKMLTLPEGTEESFAAENNLSAMTAREVEQAVKRVREESLAALEKEQERRREAERRAEDAEHETAETERLRAENVKALRQARAELEDTERMLTESQQEYNRLQGEMLDIQSAAAKGDVERAVTDRLTCESFSTAVRAFLGSVAQMPYMGNKFLNLEADEEYTQWDEMLAAVEDWTRRARSALNMVGGGEVVA